MPHRTLWEGLLWFQQGAGINEYFKRTNQLILICTLCTHFSPPTQSLSRMKGQCSNTTIKDKKNFSLLGIMNKWGEMPLNKLRSLSNSFKHICLTSSRGLPKYLGFIVEKRHEMDNNVCLICTFGLKDGKQEKLGTITWKNI